MRRQPSPAVPSYTCHITHAPGTNQYITDATNKIDQNRDSRRPERVTDRVASWSNAFYILYIEGIGWSRGSPGSICIYMTDISGIDQVSSFHLTHISLSFTVISFTTIFMLFDLYVSMKKWTLICSTFLGTINLLHFTPLFVFISSHLVIISYFSYFAISF